MKPMQKTRFPRFHGAKEIVPLVLVALLLLAVCAVFALLRLWGLLIAWIALLAAAVVLVLLARRAYFEWLAEEKPSNYFHDFGKRNMNALAVGSTKAWRFLNTDGLGDRLYPCLTYRRSLTMDLETLKTFHSHVRPGGYVFLFIDWKEIQKIGETIYARDWKYANPLSFLALDVKSNDITKKEPLLYDTGFLFGYVLRSVPKRLGLCSRTGWRRSNRTGNSIDAARVQALAERLQGAVQFCRERDLKPVLLLLSGDAETNRANELLSAQLAECAFPVRDAQELNALIGSMLSDASPIVS